MRHTRRAVPRRNAAPHRRRPMAAVRRRAGRYVATSARSGGRGLVPRPCSRGRRNAPLLAQAPQDAEELRSAVRDRPNVRLVVVDTLPDIAGPIDDSSNTSTRSAYGPLVAMAAASGVAVLGIAHLRKGGPTEAAQNRILGSVGTVNLARSVLMVFADPDDPKQIRRMLGRIKSNLAPRAESVLRFHTEGPPARIVWDGEVSGDVESLIQRADTMAQASGEAAKDEPEVEWLGDLLAAGPVPEKQVRTEAKSAGFSWNDV